MLIYMDLSSLLMMNNKLFVGLRSLFGEEIDSDSFSNSIGEEKRRMTKSPFLSSLVSSLFSDWKFDVEEGNRE